jgi:hypothetical protein
MEMGLDWHMNRLMPVLSWRNVFKAWIEGYFEVSHDESQLNLRDGE